MFLAFRSDKCRQFNKVSPPKLQDVHIPKLCVKIRFHSSVAGEIFSVTGAWSCSVVGQLCFPTSVSSSQALRWTHRSWVVRVSSRVIRLTAVRQWEKQQKFVGEEKAELEKLSHVLMEAELMSVKWPWHFLLSGQSGRYRKYVISYHQHQFYQSIGSLSHFNNQLRWKHTLRILKIAMTSTNFFLIALWQQIRYFKFKSLALKWILTFSWREAREPPTEI